MDQVKTGEFIAQMRKEKNLTQNELAEKLNISNKTVSKWETGKGMPEVSLMLPLCEVLGITVNELLSGENITSENYNAKAEENFISIIKEKEYNKKKITIALIVMAIALACAIALCSVVEYTELPTYATVILITVAMILMFGTCFVVCAVDNTAGSFECRECKTKFVPSYKAYVFGLHTPTTRLLKCPNCGKTTWAKKRLTK